MQLSRMIHPRAARLVFVVEAVEPQVGSSV